MPEIVFAVIGPTATGLAGISPDAPDDVVETLPRLPKTLEVDNNDAGTRPAKRNNGPTRGIRETTLTNQTGPLLKLRASFPLTSSDAQPELLVDGAPVGAAIEYRANRQRAVSILVPVGTDQTKSVKMN